MGHALERRYPRAVDEGEETPLDPSSLLRPWERLPRETDQDWAYFRLFLDSAYPQGPNGEYVPRNATDLARTIGVARETLAQRSCAFHWVQRAGAWDREVERRRKDTDLSEVQRSRAKWLRIAEKARNLGESELDKLLARSVSDPTIPCMTAKDALAVMDWARTAERQYLQEGRVKDADTAGDVDLENLALEDLEQLHEIIQRSKAPGT